VNSVNGITQTVDRWERERLLEVKNLQTHFFTEQGVVKAVNDVSYHVDEQEIVGIVGESGCGKSVTQLSIMQLVGPPGRTVAGEVIFEGRNLLDLKPNGPEIRSIRGGKIAMIFQEPMTSLNPVRTIGRQLSEMLKLHMGMKPAESKDRVIEMLSMVGIPEAAARLDDYPHQFSGGMRQRVMIAMGMMCNPRILIADEPTTALDVTTQAQLLEMMTDVTARLKSSLVVVTHNLGIVARYAHRIYIMYAGKVVESGGCEEIFENPRHPYTVGLLNSVPRLDRKAGCKLVPIPGMPPSLINLSNTCPFLARCASSIDRCKEEPCPELRTVGGDHQVRCHVNLEEIRHGCA
jgi:peptide/nickel transport system ATP-binding protein